jgi:hypothetical protein
MTRRPEPWPLLARSHFPLCLSRPKLGILSSLFCAIQVTRMTHVPQALAVVAQVFQFGPRTQSHQLFSQLSSAMWHLSAVFLLSAYRFDAAARARSPLCLGDFSIGAATSPGGAVTFFLPKKRRAKKTAMDPGRFFKAHFLRASAHQVSVSGVVA